MMQVVQVYFGLKQSGRCLPIKSRPYEGISLVELSCHGELSILTSSKPAPHPVEFVGIGLEKASTRCQTLCTMEDYAQTS